MKNSIEGLKQIARHNYFPDERKNAIKQLGEIPSEEAILALIEIARYNYFPDERKLAQIMITKLSAEMKKNEEKPKFIDVLKRIGDISNIDDVLFAYLKECIGAYNSKFFLASTFFLGSISERSIDLLIESYLNWCKKKGIPNYDQIEKALNVQSIKTKEKNLRNYFDKKFINKLNKVNNDKTIEIFDFDTVVGPAFQAYRLNRNDIGHVKTANVDLDILVSLIVLMEKYLKIIFKIIELLDASKI